MCVAFLPRLITILFLASTDAVACPATWPESVGRLGDLSLLLLLDPVDDTKNASDETFIFCFVLFLQICPEAGNLQ